MTQGYTISLKDLIARLTRQPKPNTETDPISDEVTLAETLSNTINLTNQSLTEQPRRKNAREVSHIIGHYLAQLGGASWAGMPIDDERTPRRRHVQDRWTYYLVDGDGEDRLFLTSAAHCWRMNA
ncbi:hypothetical protein BBP40_003555 [Aspergillus hancockii]|nr:hypothetical protein BBP40_003555 [Aspergillus hancockii]